MELGCGGGGLWKRNFDRIPEKCQILLTDFTDGMLQDARQNLAGKGIFEFNKVDANDRPLPFGDASFDIVIGNHMVNYISDRQGLFSEIVRILKPNGRFYTSTIGQQHTVEIRELISEFDPVLGASWQNVSSPFILENGAGQLSLWFKDVSLRRYEDALEVMEVDPLVDYILSIGLLNLSEDRQDKFKELIKRKMEGQGGVFHILKEGGIYEAVRV
ncbi:class I SAM-dependent methyltransferase [Chloroflexota bacterium]